MHAVAGYVRISERLVEVGIGGRCREGVINRPSTRTDGGAGLTSLQEGRRHSGACVRCPSPHAIVENHPTRQGEVVALAAKSTICRVLAST